MQDVMPTALESADDFIRQLEISNPLWQGDTWIFRGQSDDSWELHPSAFRDSGIVAAHVREVFDRRYKMSREFEEFDSMVMEMLTIHNKRKMPNGKTIGEVFNTDEDSFRRRYILASSYTNTVKNLAATFEELSDRVHLDLPVERYPTRWDLPLTLQEQVKMAFDNDRLFTQDDPIAEESMRVIYALAQHHRVPTMLLDWTYNPLTAAYFAADAKDRPNSDLDCIGNENDERRPEHIAVWAVRQKDLFELRLRAIKHRRSQIGFLRAQDGLFVYDTNAEMYFLMLGYWMPFNRHLASIEESGGVYRFTLPFDQRKRVLQRLDERNITRPHLMPSFDHVADEVKRRHNELFDKFFG